MAAAALTMVVAVTLAAPAAVAFTQGHGSSLKLWAVSLSGIQWVPAVLSGAIYNRFPSGRPVGRLGTLLDRLLLWGTGVMVVVGILITGPDKLDFVGPTRRIVDQTPIPRLLGPAEIGVPALILLGSIAGISVIVRYVRSSGLERKQLAWVAAAAGVNLLVFPFAVTGLIPAWLGYALLFILPLSVLVPVLRYDLWAIDSIIRRSATHHLISGEKAVQAMVRGMGEMLKLPYVAIQRGDRLIASYGAPVDEVETWPLVHEGETVGQLVAAPRYGYESISEQDRQVLASTGDLVAGSMRADALTSDLIDARQSLVTAREEERRRLRRDLHDGLGPMLTGIGLNLDAARANPEKAADYLANAKDASKRVITEIRDLVYGLRPPMLDELGLTGALRVQVEKAGAESGLVIKLHAPDRLQLPAAVEVAVFRTIIEAINNVVKHSDATQATATISCGQALTVTVEDDGSAKGPWTPSVGLIGMRERAEELGGKLDAGPTDRGGRICTTFPLQKEET